MMAIGVSVNGMLIFIWMAEQAEAERIRETIPRIAKEAGTTPVELFKAALNAALEPERNRGEGAATRRTRPANAEMGAPLDGS